MLIDSFVNAIFLYDDKMLINFNYKEGTRTVTFDDVLTARLPVRIWIALVHQRDSRKTVSFFLCFAGRAWYNEPKSKWSKEEPL